MIFIYKLHVWVFCWNKVANVGWAQGIMLSLSSGSQIGRKQQRERGKEKVMQFELIHICYHHREPGNEVCACVCLQKLTDMVFSRVGRVQLSLPATLVPLPPQWPTNCNHEWLRGDNTRLWHLQYCWKTYFNVDCTYLMTVLMYVSLTLTFLWGK